MTPLALLTLLSVYLQPTLAQTTLLDETFDDASQFTMVQDDGSAAEFFSDGSSDYVCARSNTAILQYSHDHVSWE